MATLQSLLLDKDRRAHVVKDCVDMIDQEVRSKSGLSGIAVKGAYAIIKKIKPGIVEEVVEKLVEPFATNLDPFYQSFQSQGSAGSFASFLGQKPTDVANALLAITDERAQNSDNRTMRSAYERLRPTGVKHVEAAVPAIGSMLERYV